MLLMMLTVAFVLLGFVNLIAFALAAVFGILAYLLYQQTNVEFEYLYLDREVSIDKIIHKSKRKKLGSYGIDRMIVFAPVHSYHLDDYKNVKLSEKDYSIGVEQQPDRRYVFLFEGQEKLLLSPTPEFVAALKNAAPRKVFTD
jgi:hypothetical protein